MRDELRAGTGRRCSKTHAERRIRACGAVAIQYRPQRGANGCTRCDGTGANSDLVNRQFDPGGPDQLWVVDVIEHPTARAKVHLAVVIGLFGFQRG